MSSKINKSLNMDKSKTVKAIIPDINDLISFSFKYLDFNNEKFNIEKTSENYFISVVEKLKNLSTFNKKELLNNHSKALRFHQIDFKDDSVSEDFFGIPKEDEIVDIPYQFQISSNEHGRVHGFFINNIFYIVWFDRNHNLYPSKK